MPLITTGAIPGSRFEHASVFISAGMFAVWGGGTDLTGRGGLDASLYLFNLGEREWVQVEAPPESPTPSGRYGHSLSAVGSYLVVFGGRVDGRFLDDLWLFDLNTLGSIPAWERCETSVRPASRAYHTCITDGDRIILFGGTDGLYHYSDSWSFDIRTRQWTELECIGFIPSPREGHAAALVGDVMYTFGGRGPGGVDLGDLAALNLPAQRWFMFQNMGPVPSRRFGHGMAAKKGRVFLMGGSSLDDEKGVTMGLVHILDTRSIKYPINKAHPLNPAPSKGPREDADLEQRDKSDTHVSDLGEFSPFSTPG
ncbi:hypothetical protein BC834DRAFT_826003 [Gloeopeniophorella convolvens]|nr:hypothetical protein BC834DRAFT_826003 [Gloeopeniophorella convolvens]